MTRKNSHPLFLLSLLLILTLSCEKTPLGHDSDFLTVPVGRSFLGASSVDVSIAGQEYEAGYRFDSCGGYWILIHKSLLSSGDNIKIRFTRRSEELNLFPELVGEKQDWVLPSTYIDSDHEGLISKAEDLTDGFSTRLEKAKVIHNYVRNHVGYSIYRDASLDKASITEELGYGTCMNASRLFVALCRAVNVPARTVWGVVNAHDDVGGYNNHHQWAESLDDSGYWHPADFGYTIDFDLNDIRYLDLIYAAEENSIIKSRKDYHIIFENLVYTNDYPTAIYGKIRFKLLDDCRPDSMVVEHSYDYFVE